MEKLNKLSLPAVIVIASVILGSFYYASEVSKQKSIERQQENKIAEERRMEAKAEREKNLESLEKTLCVGEAEQTATELYRDYCTKANYCTYKEGTFLTTQYEAAYSRCLQSKGLK